jgi:type VI secretion system protein VasG
VDHILTRTLLPEISREFLARMASGEPISQVRIGVEGGAFKYDIS